jgi:hypothetical protein
MPRLVPNPIADLLSPLQRIEHAITALADKLRPVDALPAVHEELERVNRTLGAMLLVLEEIRDEVAAGSSAAAKPPGGRAATAAAAKRPAA